LYEHEENFCGFGKDRCVFWIGKSDESHPVSKNIHIAFSVNKKADVDSFHKQALELGLKDNGVPGYREMYGPGYYAAFVLDEDQNNIEVVFRE
jgi:predicted lactoylglutathione lyase